MVIRHGQKCFVYGHYMNGKSGRNESAGLRAINPNNTFFNNYVENLEGGNKEMKAPIVYNYQRISYVYNGDWNFKFNIKKR